MLSKAKNPVKVKSTEPKVMDIEYVDIVTQELLSSIYVANRNKVLRYLSTRSSMVRGGVRV